MHLKVFVKLEKKPKNPLVWAKKTQKTQKKTKKNLKKTKNPQKTHWAGFFFFYRVLSNPGLQHASVHVKKYWY